MNKDELRPLYARLDVATVLDWDLGRDLISALVDVDAPNASEFYGTSGCVTVSIDAAVALVEEVLPGVMWKIGCGRKGSRVVLPWCELGGRYGFHEATASTVPLAILKALVLALLDREENQ